MAEEIKAQSIQKHMEIDQIRDDLIVLKDGGLRAIMMCTSVNFALKSTEEQDALIYKYQGFLNSLDFSIQIMVASRNFVIDPYIKALQLKEREQANELLRIQTAEYIEFIKGLTEMANIMTESFYVVIPFAPIAIKKIESKTKLFGKKGQAETKLQEQEFLECKNQLWQRVEFVASGLRGCSIKSAPLVTEELIELFYKFYNPNAKEDLEITKAKELRIQ